MPPACTNSNSLLSCQSAPVCHRAADQIAGLPDQDGLACPVDRVTTGSRGWSGRLTLPVPSGTPGSQPHAGLTSQEEEEQVQPSQVEVVGQPALPAAVGCEPTDCHDHRACTARARCMNGRLWGWHDVGPQSTAGRHSCTCLGKPTPVAARVLGSSCIFRASWRLTGAAAGHNRLMNQLQGGCPQSKAVGCECDGCRPQDLCWQAGSRLPAKGAAYASRRCHMHAKMERRQVSTASLAQDLCWQAADLLHVQGSAYASGQCHRHAGM